MPPSVCTSHLYFPLLIPPLFGWLLCVFSLIGVGGLVKPVCSLFLFNFVIQIVARINDMPPPPALQTSRTTCQTSLLPQTPIVGWLLCLHKAPFPLFFLTCVVLHPKKNKPTNGGATDRDHGRLAWDHGMRMPWHHVLWAPLIYPWSERTKPLGGRVAVAHLVVVCFAFCVLCFVFCVVVASGLLAKELYQ